MLIDLKNNVNNMKVTIEPYKGILFGDKDLHFGISQKILKKELGEAAKIEIDNIMNEVREYRSGMVFTFIGKKLNDITVSRHVELYFENIRLFDNENVISELSNYDTPTLESKGGYMNFYKLGISLGGFGKRKIPEKRLVCIFPEERKKFYEIILRM
jgi:hypothetical protein